VTAAARLAVTFLAGMVAVLLAGGVISFTRGTPLWDVQAYWEAALRLREGQPLYDPNLSSIGNTAYRYAPWFAAAWVPLTYLPVTLVFAVWGVAVWVAWAACLWPFRRQPAVVLLFGGLTFHAAWVGNVQSLMLLPLIYRLERREGPIWLGIATSLKGVPILLAGVYLVRRQWRRAVVAVGIAAVLTAPILLFDLSGYPAVRVYNLYDLGYLLPLAAAGIQRTKVDVTT
jgi:hypothetical protein